MMASASSKNIIFTFCDKTIETLLTDNSTTAARASFSRSVMKLLKHYLLITQRQQLGRHFHVLWCVSVEYLSSPITRIDFVQLTGTCVLCLENTQKIAAWIIKQRKTTKQATQLATCIMKQAIQLATVQPQLFILNNYQLLFISARRIAPLFIFNQCLTAVCLILLKFYLLIYLP